jgi:hypothetical protein
VYGLHLRADELTQRMQVHPKHADTPPEPDIPTPVSGPAAADAGQGRLCAMYRRVPATSVCPLFAGLAA